MFYLPDEVTVNGERFTTYISKETLDKRISEIGQDINRDFADKRPIFIGILNGSFIFLADLMRHVSVPCEVDFIKLSSYGDEKVSSGKVTERKELDANVTGRHIILVEDIVDTGLSLSYMINIMKEKHPLSVTVISLLHKEEATRYDIEIDYVGFKIKNEFVLGYGLDYAQEGRNLAQIYILSPES
jgi:hypoxanthine phosphoribosyltransferase